MQATVSAYDPTTSDGQLLLDDGVRLEFGADALAGSELLHLRPGQRVHVTMSGTTVTALAIIRR